jgi:hypothetical protein
MALSSYGSTLSIGGSSVSEIISLSVGGSSVAEIDVSTIDSATKSFTTGIEDGGTVSLEVFTPANYSGGIAALVPTAGTTTASACVINFGNPSGAYITASFSALIVSHSIAAAMDTGVRSSVTLKLTTTITWSN